MWNLETIRRGKLSNDGEVAVLQPGKPGLKRTLEDVDLVTADCSKKTVGHGTEGKKHSHPTHTGIGVGASHVPLGQPPPHPAAPAHAPGRLPGSESAAWGSGRGGGLTWLGLSRLVGPSGCQPCRKRGCLKGRITHGHLLLEPSQDDFHGAWGSPRVGWSSQGWVVEGKQGRGWRRLMVFWNLEQGLSQPLEPLCGDREEGGHTRGEGQAEIY